MNRSLLLSAGAFVVLCVGGRLSAQGPVQLTDNFDNGAIDPPLVISNYVQEDYGTFAPYSELEATETGGQLSFHGTGIHDVVLFDGYGGGWVGRAAYAPVPPLAGGDMSVEAKIRFETATLGPGSGSDAGYFAGVLVEANNGNRVAFYMIENVGGPKLECTVDVAHNLGVPDAAFRFERGRTYELRLELNVETGQVRALVDGVARIQFTFQGDRGMTRAGVMAGVRGVGDILDARFDDLEISYTPEEPLGALRSIQSQLDGDGTTANVSLDLQVDSADLVSESFDPGWTPSEISDGGTAASGEITWAGVSRRVLTYRLSRDTAFVRSEAKIQGRVEVGGERYRVDGADEIEGSLNPYLDEVLLTGRWSSGGSTRRGAILFPPEVTKCSVCVSSRSPRRATGAFARPSRSPTAWAFPVLRS